MNEVADDKLLSKKKPTFPVHKRLKDYLIKYNRESKITVAYDDLLRFQGAVTVYDANDEDTLWVRCYYPDHEREHIDRDLKHIYDVLHSDGRDQSQDFLSVDAVDYCTFGNTKPFRLNKHYRHLSRQRSFE